MSKRSPAATDPAGWVLCCGNSVLDIVVRPVEFPEWGKTRWVESIEQHLGGNGANTSYALAKLGVKVALASGIGNDDAGRHVLEFLCGVGVDVSAVQECPLPTPSTVVLVHPNGSRALLHRPGASLTLTFSGLELRRPGVTRFHLANLFALPALRPHAADLLRDAKAAGLITSVDTGWDAKGEWIRTLEPLLPHTDLLFVNEDEARELSGLGEPERAAGFFLERGACDVVIKLGERGCALYGRHGDFHLPAFPVACVDTTGAGDSFAGGFLAALVRGCDHAEAARIANAVGALSVSTLGSVAGLRNWEETVRWMEQPPAVAPL